MQTQTTRNNDLAQVGSQGGDDPDTAPPVKSFLTITETLAGLIDRETELMEQRRFQEAGTLAEEKARLTGEFQSALATLRAQGSALLGPEDSDIRRRLKAAGEDFRTRLARHARLVTRLKTMNEGLVRAISREAERQRDPVRRYGGDGHVGSAPTQPTSLTLDRNI